MSALTYLLNVKLSGIKNIEKEIEIDFYKRSIPKEFSPYGYNVKAIYSENGSGKTAIVTAVDLLKKLLIMDGFLNSIETQRYLDEIINKKTNRFSFACDVLDRWSGRMTIYSYSISISKSSNENYVIEHEKLSFRSRTGSVEKDIFECINGEIIQLSCNEETETIIKAKSANVISSRSFIANAIDFRSSISDPSMKKALFTIMLFGLSIHTYFDTNDQHDLYFLSKKFKEMQEDSDQTGDLILSILFNVDKFTSVRAKKISKDDFEEYSKKIKRLEKFLKLFKPDLESITIDKKINRDYYECSLIMNYEGYSVDREFESTGIKRLINLFDYFDYAAEGEIVFIDEMDANINDIYLCKLVDFLMEYGKGQVCFTTHNTSPMKVLKRNRNSIDFLSNDNKIIPWKTNGNYSPENLYRAGMIQYLPFNVESTDFIGIFGGEDD